MKFLVLNKTKIIEIRICLIIIAMFYASTKIQAAETIRMSIGEVKTLSPSILPTKVLAGQPTWTSSRPNDVIIESYTMYSCTIKAIKSFSGHALVQCVYRYRELDPITGRYIYQRAAPINYHVFVSEQEPTNITIYPTDLVMDFGALQQMSITVSPSTASQKVTWTTTDRAVATVNEDNVLGACGYGVAIVTATTSNGLSASCKVTVSQNKIEPTNVSLPTTMELKKGSSAVLIPTLKPSNSSSTYTWESSDTDIVSVSSEGKIKGHKEGAATITVITANNLSAKCEVTVINDEGKNHDKKMINAVRRIEMLVEKSKVLLFH